MRWANKRGLGLFLCNLTCELPVLCATTLFDCIIPTCNALMTQLDRYEVDFIYSDVHCMAVEWQYIHSGSKPVFRAVFDPTLTLLGVCISAEVLGFTRRVARMEAVKKSINSPAISIATIVISLTKVSKKTLSLSEGNWVPVFEVFSFVFHSVFIYLCEGTPSAVHNSITSIRYFASRVRQFRL